MKYFVLSWIRRCEHNRGQTDIKIKILLRIYLREQNRDLFFNTKFNIRLDRFGLGGCFAWICFWFSLDVNINIQIMDARIRLWPGVLSRKTFLMRKKSPRSNLGISFLEDFYLVKLSKKGLKCLKFPRHFKVPCTLQ